MYNNKITAIDTSNYSNLLVLDCSDNSITGLTLNTNLQSLTCKNNNFSTLNISTITGLTYLDCGGNNLTSVSK